MPGGRGLHQFRYKLDTTAYVIHQVKEEYVEELKNLHSAYMSQLMGL